MKRDKPSRSGFQDSAKQEPFEIAPSNKDVTRPKSKILEAALLAVENMDKKTKH